MDQTQRVRLEGWPHTEKERLNGVEPATAIPMGQPWGTRLWGGSEPDTRHL